MEIVAIFCDIDDFCLKFEPAWQQRLVTEGKAQPFRARRLCLSEVMTIVVSFHQSGYRTFKDYFLRYVTPHLHGDFPYLVSYTRFVELRPAALVPLCAYLQTRKWKSHGVAFTGKSLGIEVISPRRSSPPSLRRGGS